MFLSGGCLGYEEYLMTSSSHRMKIVPTSSNMNHVFPPPTSLPHVSPYWSDPEGNIPNLPPPLGDLDRAHPPPSCPKDSSPCNASAPYRSMSGYCNNLKSPLLGASGHLMRPLLPPMTGKKWMDGWIDEWILKYLSEWIVNLEHWVNE
ncbi:hypothetical protein Pmani_018991 [Petrolisthes manimaculis]|uniref:Uncharacterized protein n=1 Tax=Petrolisthes manimaculis TaxID=1843537 RepID=A0AAE1PLD4_9EUCA|nr:hypothetical protein Pmani_018991 [Petrolisthes manimaculis]